MSASRKPRSEKGHKAFNPNESFCLSVSWILRNPQVAKEMLSEGLQVCAKATQRDTPCVPMYMFRKAYDQSPAEEYAQTIKTIGDHPHYAKIFKSNEMGIPVTFSKVKLSTAGIDAAPLEWPPSTPFDAEKKAQLGFAPVVMSFTEIYLDARSFFEHADSPDYLSAYGVVMQGHRSLTAKTKCLGTPTDYIFDTVLGPYLQAERVKDSTLKFEQSNAVGEQGSWAFIEFCVPHSSDASELIADAIKSLKTTCSLTFQDDSKLRVEVALRWPADLSALNTLGIAAGQMFLFVPTDSLGNVTRPESLPSCIQFYVCDGQALFHDQADGQMFSAGYAMHPLVLELQADETVTYKKNPTS